MGCILHIVQDESMIGSNMKLLATCNVDWEGPGFIYLLSGNFG